MKSLLTIILSLTFLAATAQPCKVPAGTKTLYEPQQSSYSNPPKGYEPFFINHVGRHGSRHLTKDPNTTLAYKLLMQADSLRFLTAEGLGLKKMILLLQAVEKPGLKSISQRGSDELKGIAERMVAHNKNLFAASPEMTVEITKEVRTAQSADAFLKGLHDDTHTLSLKKIINDTALRFYDLAPAYLEFEEKGSWQHDVKQIALTKNITAGGLQTFTTKFFKPGFRIVEADKEVFCKDIYGFAVIVPSVSNEIIRSGNTLNDLNFSGLFTCKQLTALSELDEAEDFLLKGPGRDTLGIQVKIAVPLLVEFLNNTDSILQKAGGTSVSFRFAHAETIAPFAALMQLAAASRPVNELGEFTSSWKASKIVPLSANIQWVFYKKNDSDDYLVKFLLNEKESALKGLDTTLFPFYRWNEVRNFYTNLLRKLGVSLAGHMDTYLLNLK